jgi:hypothetical protein
MFFRMLAQLVQLGLQFDDRFLEIELMFHASGRLNIVFLKFNANRINAKGRTCVRPPR